MSPAKESAQIDIGGSVTIAKADMEMLAPAAS